MPGGFQELLSIFDEMARAVQVLHDFGAHYGIEAFMRKRTFNNVFFHVSNKELNFGKCFASQAYSRNGSIDAVDIKTEL